MDITYLGGSFSLSFPTGSTDVSFYGTVNRVDIGLTKTTNCRAATVYADHLEVWDEQAE